jgi:hypothetical protein
VGSHIAKLRISSLRAQIEASRNYTQSLARQFDAAPSFTEQAEIASRFHKALKQLQGMEFMLELLERKERESADETADT